MSHTKYQQKGGDNEGGPSSRGEGEESSNRGDKRQLLPDPSVTIYVPSIGRNNGEGRTLSEEGEDQISSPILTMDANSTTSDRNYPSTFLGEPVTPGLAPRSPGTTSMVSQGSRGGTRFRRASLVSFSEGNHYPRTPSQAPSTSASHQRNNSFSKPFQTELPKYGEDTEHDNSFLLVRKDDVEMKWFPAPYFEDQKTENSFCEFVFHGRKLVALIVFSVSLEFAFILAFYQELSVGYQALCGVGMVLCCILSAAHIIHCLWPQRFTPQRVSRVEEGVIVTVFALTLLSQSVLAYPKQNACALEFPDVEDSCRNYVDHYLIAAIEAFCVIAPARFMFVLPVTVATLLLLALSILWHDNIERNRHWGRVAVEVIIAIVNLVSCVIRETSQRKLFKNYLAAENKTRVNKFAGQCITLLLNDILPASSIKQIQARNIEITKTKAAVFRSDIISFTSWSSPKDSYDVVNMLKTLVDYYDTLSRKLDITKVKTIGDAYWAIKELGNENSKHAAAVLTMAEFAVGVKQFTVAYFDSSEDMPAGIRMGVATGSICHTTIGTQQLSFEVFGPATELAETLEQKAPHNSILIDYNTAELISNSLYVLSRYNPPAASSSTTTTPLFILHSQGEEEDVVDEVNINRGEAVASESGSSSTAFSLLSGSKVGGEVGGNPTQFQSPIFVDDDENAGFDIPEKLEDSELTKELKEINDVIKNVRSGTIRSTFLPRFRPYFEKKFVEFGLVAERVPFRGCGIALTVLIIALATALSVGWSSERAGNIIVLWVVAVFSGAFPTWSFISHPKSRTVTSIALLLYYSFGGIAIAAAGLMTPPHYLTRSVFYLRLAFAVLKGSIITVPNTPGFLYDIVFPSGAVVVVMIVRTPDNDAERKLRVEQIVWLLASFYVGYLCRIVMELSNRETYLQMQRSIINQSLLVLIQNDARRVIDSAVPQRFTLEIFRWYFEMQRQGAASITLRGNTTTPPNVEGEGEAYDPLPLLPDLLAPATVKQRFPNAAIGFIKVISEVEGSNVSPANNMKHLKSTLQILSSCFAKTENYLKHFPNVLKIKTVANTLIVAVLPIVDTTTESTPEQTNEAAAELFLFSVLQLFTSQERSKKVSLQIGLHMGQVTGCVLGTSRLSYDLLGDAMNTASRLCSTADPNEIAMSMEFQNAVRQGLQGVNRIKYAPLTKYSPTVAPLLERFSAPQSRAMKGKGDIMVTRFTAPDFMLNTPTPSTPATPSLSFGKK